MGIYLNCKSPYKQYRALVNEQYFVDKTAFLKELLPFLGKENRYFCFTRPRRFGKTIMANMIAAFLGKAENSADIFSHLEIGSWEQCLLHLNQHDIIYIDFSEVPRDCQSYQQYIDRIQQALADDLFHAFPGVISCEKNAVWDMLSEIFEKTGKSFVFIFDEWDAIFHMPFVYEKEQGMYLLFLKTLLKNKGYVDLAYMTGILPITKYSDGSELNMFAEYTMTAMEKFSGYFGFSDKEVERLYQKYKEYTENPAIMRDELRLWYDGYYTAAGNRLYNPRSIVCALINNQLSNYWTSSGTYDSVFSYIKDNAADIRDDLVLMISGRSVPAQIEEYAATSMRLETKDEIYSAMVVYGLLTYQDGYVSIPNKELMGSFAAVMKKEKSLGYVYQLASASSRMLKATLEGDTAVMAEILEYAHNTESPMLSYNSEIDLSAVVNLVYLSARDWYQVEREEKAGEGYVDFIFYPVRKNADGIILELKVDASPEEAIQQIKDRKYILRFLGKLGETSKYTGRILAVGISYYRKTKKHLCKIEILKGE